MKKPFLTKTLLALAVATSFVACSSDDDAPIVVEPIATCSDGIQNGNETGVDCGGSCAPCDTGSETPAPETLSGEFDDDTTLTNDRIYFLAGKVVVPEGVTLTIEPGTILKGLEGEGSLASALVVARGGRINAVGTAEEPIIFTSEFDNIEVGQTAGTNLDQNDSRLWGGVLVLGRAPISASGDAAEVQIEGIPASDAFGLYGGNDPADDSGDIAYISIRHAGALIGEGNEINGLTLGGVGNATSINQVEIVGNEDDGIEIFGGTVNVTNVFVWAGGDDGIDLDQAWTGTMTNAMVVQGARSDSALELDGPEGTLDGAFTLENVTIVGYTGADAEGSRRIADFRDGLQANINNVFVTGFQADTQIRLNGAGSATAFTDGLLTLSNWEIVLPEGVADVTTLLNDTEGTTTFADGAFITPVTEAGTGADTSAFAWTYSNAKAELGF